MELSLRARSDLDRRTYERTEYIRRFLSVWHFLSFVYLVDLARESRPFVGTPGLRTASDLGMNRSLRTSRIIANGAINTKLTDVWFLPLFFPSGTDDRKKYCSHITPLPRNQRQYRVWWIRFSSALRYDVHAIFALEKSWSWVIVVRKTLWTTQITLNSVAENRNYIFYVVQLLTLLYNDEGVCRAFGYGADSVLKFHEFPVKFTWNSWK